SILSLAEPAHPTLEDQSGFVSAKVIMAMNVALLFSAICYLVMAFAPHDFLARLGRRAAQFGAIAGAAALLLRWHESYLLGEEYGHAPVSNLYEVFVLLFVITVGIFLALERRHRAQAVGAFLMPLVAAGVFFLIWMDSIGAGDIKPLVPALQSYWMKIHVPMNFIGYGAFAVACAFGIGYLVRERLERTHPDARLLKALPTLDTLDQLMYKAVAIGFPAFTLATILGAAWAAEAWGGYWSWDPKETWALIVWLVYGAWLHMRITHGWRGHALAWWAVGGFLVTLFCFLGVNMYLSGLHSYGRLA
ncbi:MAG: c-type cytochrome biogenesis protein CcsB, partial [Zetaproteobacteria bacterium]